MADQRPRRLPPDRRLLRAAGLKHGGPEDLVIRRRRFGKGFAYFDATGARIRDAGIIARLRSLAIPPNYRDVRIAADPGLHLQAVGRDEAGRTQYRYHPEWERVREHRKLGRLATIAQRIGRIRRRVARDIAKPAGTREKALAAVVLLIDRTHIRIGCEDYVHSGRSRGAATLLRRNVDVEGDDVRLSFRGKGGRKFGCAIRAAALARAVEDLRTLPGRRVFQYRDDGGRVRPVTATDANAYLREIAGAPVTAKDFRMLGANAEAATLLAAMQPGGSPTARRRQVAGVVRHVAELLGNTPAVVRKSYVHATVVAAFEAEGLAALCAAVRPSAGRRRGEELVAMLLLDG